MKRPLTESQMRHMAFRDLAQTADEEAEFGGVDIDRFAAEYAAEELQSDPLAVAEWLCNVSEPLSLDVYYYEHRPADELTAQQALAVVMAGSQKENVLKAAFRLRQLFNVENVGVIKDRATDIKNELAPGWVHA